MEKSLAARLTEGTDSYDASLYARLVKLGSEYIRAGVTALNFHVREFDAANDAVQCFGPLTRADFERKDALADPRHYIHPMTATEMSTLATFLSQILGGKKTARTVDARGDEDEDGAEMLNELLQWNDDQQKTYEQLFNLCWDACVFNRGIQYERWKPIIAVELEPVEEDDHDAEPIHGMNKNGQPRYTRSGEPIMVQPKTTRWRKKRKIAGGFTAIENVSPYHFICDPMLPLCRMQEMRFTGHRVMIPWHELDRRSNLPPDDYDYVLPAAVKRLKQRKTSAQVFTQPGAPAANTTLQSRTFLERTRRGQPQGGIGATDAVNKEDGGMVECFVLYITAKPSAHGIYEDDEDNEKIEFLMAGEKELLACNVQPNLHDEYPYAVAEPRPNAHQQFSASWATVIKGIQDGVDDLRRRHSEHLARSGVILLADGTKCDIADFLDDTGRIRLVVQVKEDAAGTPFDQIIREIKISDPTANFPNEIELLKKEAEEATGAHAFVQGQKEGPNTTATEFVGVQQMATGRISTLARLIAQQVLMPQTRRIAMNFQQFMPDEVTVRLRGESHSAYDPEKPAQKQRTILRDSKAFAPEDERSQMPDIQCQFDVIPHDGSLPSADTQKVAALSRAIEAFASQPALAPIFDDTVPGNLDTRAMFIDELRAIGMQTERYRVDKERAMKNLKAKMMAAGAPIPPGMFPEQPGQPEAQTEGQAQSVPEQAGNVTPFPAPSADQLPQTPGAEAPAPTVAAP